MSKSIKITIEGDQGSGKTRALEILRGAGWRVTPERAVGSSNQKIEATAFPPEYSCPFECGARNCGGGCRS